MVLVDRADFPGDKTCGSRISPEGIAQLKDLGVWDEVERHDYWIKGLRRVTPGDREIFLFGGGTAAAMVCNRRVLDELLLRKAQSLGVRFVPNKIVRSLIEGEGRVVGFRDDDGDEFRARVVFVADGGHSRLIPERAPRQILQAIMGWREDVSFTPNHVEMRFDPNVVSSYGGLFPESATRVNIGTYYRDDEKKLNARKLFQTVLARQYKQRLEGARQVGEWKGHPILYSCSIEKLTSPGRMVLGEAGRMTHPATGEGLYQGMRSGVFAAEAVKEILMEGATEKEAFNRYENCCRRAFQASFWGAKAFQKEIGSPALEWAARAAARPLVKRMAGMLMAEM